jgi:hypothetical protein
MKTTILLFAKSRGENLALKAPAVTQKPAHGASDRLGARGINRPSGLLAPHPLQVRARDNQLQPLFVTMADRELLHARR